MGKSINYKISPLFIILIVICIHAIFFGSFLEEYEGIFSSMVHGTYTFPYINKWDFDNHTLLFAIYSRINVLFQNVQIYGIVLYLLAILTAINFGLILYKVIDKLDVNANRKLLFFLMFCIFLSDYLLNISYNRITIIGVVLVIANIEFNKIDKQKSSIVRNMITILGVLFFCLLNFETVLLMSALYLFVSICLRRFHLRVMIPFTISIVSTILYLTYMTHFANEATQVFFFKELEFFDRLNIDYENLDANTLINVDFLRQYLMFDDYHFTLAFYDGVAKHKPASILSNVLNGLKFDSIVTNIKASVPSVLDSIVSIVFCILAFLYLAYHSFNNLRRLLIYIFLLLFPIVLTVYFSVPSTFIETYYCLLAIYFILNCFRATRNFTVIYVILSLVFVSKTIDISTDKKGYIERHISFNIASEKIDELYAQYGKKIIFNTYVEDEFFPIKPLQKIARKDEKATFLNFYFFGSEDGYKNYWAEMCQCNPLSVEEKIDFMVSSQLPFVTTKERLEYLSYYMDEKYGKRLEEQELTSFNQRLGVYYLNYASEPKL